MKRLLIACCVLAAACTANQRARQLGGDSSEKLPCGQKLVNASWKDDDLWLLTRPMASNDSVETYSYRESSSFGILQGSVMIQECR